MSASERKADLAASEAGITDGVRAWQRQKPEDVTL